MDKLYFSTEALAALFFKYTTLMVLIRAHVICRSNPFPDVNAFDKVEIGKRQENLANDVVPMGRSIQILNFEHQCSLQHFSMAKFVSETLIEHWILCFTLHRRLTAIPLIR